MLQVISGGDDREAVLEYPGILVVVGGGWVDEELLVSLHRDGAKVVAADGAVGACVAAGVMPDAVIGDMDSISNREQFAGRTRLIEIPEQDTTDFEKCLYMTRAPVTVALGVTGKRLDHTLAALDGVARHAHDRHIVVVDETDIALGATGPIGFEVAPGERVSIHPLQRVKFARSEGLKYPVDGLTLEPGVRTGTSNAAVSGRFTIAPVAGETGSWLLIVGREHLERLIARLSAPGEDG